MPTDLPPELAEALADVQALSDLALAWGAWAVTDGRPQVFVGLMSVFLAFVVVAIARRHLPEPAEAPVFHPVRPPAGPADEGWSRDAEIAGMLLASGRASEAVQAYRRILDLDPADVDALYNLGHAYFRMRLYSQARACWRAARRLDPQADDAIANLQLVNRLLKVEGAVTGSGSPGSGTAPRCAG